MTFSSTDTFPVSFVSALAGKRPLVACMGLVYDAGMCVRNACNEDEAESAWLEKLFICLLLPLLLLLAGCAHSPPPVEVEADEPQYHPQPPILGADGTPLQPPGFYDDKGRLKEKVLDPELRALMWYINTNMAAGHTNYEDAVDYVKRHDALLAKHAGDKSVAAEQILRAKAYFYFSVWDDEENGSRLFHQLMRDYPDTPFGRYLIKQHKGHGHPDQFDQPVPPPE
jgi:hypothetical protein